VLQFIDRTWDNDLTRNECSWRRKIYGPTKKKLEYKNKKGLQYTLQGPGIVKFIKSLKLRWYGYTEIMNPRK